MSKQRKSQPWLGTLIFSLIVIISGAALAASNNMTNPFEVIPQIATFVTGGQTGGEHGNGEGFRPTGSTATSGGASTPSPSPTQRTAPNRQGYQNQAAPTGNQGQMQRGGSGGGENSSMQWNLFGKVLFNIWFFMACTTVIMVIAQVSGYLSKQYRPRAKVAG